MPSIVPARTPCSGTLIHWLLHHRLVDEIVLLPYPVIVGQGTRLHHGSPAVRGGHDLKPLTQVYRCRRWRRSTRPFWIIAASAARDGRPSDERRYLAGSDRA
jgi:hypothetical protein